MRISDWSSDVCSSDLQSDALACNLPGVLPGDVLAIEDDMPLARRGQADDAAQRRAFACAVAPQPAYGLAFLPVQGFALECGAYRVIGVDCPSAPDHRCSPRDRQHVVSGKVCPLLDKLG